MCSGVDLVGPYCHTHNYSSLPIHYVDRGRFKKTMLTGPDGGAAASAPRQRIKCTDCTLKIAAAATRAGGATEVVSRPEE